MTIMKNNLIPMERWSAPTRLLREPSLFRQLSAAERRAARKLAYEAAAAVVG